MTWQKNPIDRSISSANVAEVNAPNYKFGRSNSIFEIHFRNSASKSNTFDRGDICTKSAADLYRSSSAVILSDREDSSGIRSASAAVTFIFSVSAIQSFSSFVTQS